FFITITSVLLQGTSLTFLSRWLGLSVPERIRRRYALDMELFDNFKSELFEITIPSGNPVVGKSIVQLKFPKSAIIVMISRNQKFIRPGGSTIIEGGDTLLVMGDNKASIQAVYDTLNIQEP
ncbi:MAG TPA: TrkA C-terminal domain-containing protein, partial [Ohtaekwangia sp.]|nr:TrkA C-terminal domain-containing protein [Ohtaekwangia sp.]